MNLFTVRKNSIKKITALLTQANVIMQYKYDDNTGDIKKIITLSDALHYLNNGSLTSSIAQADNKNLDNIKNLCLSKSGNNFITAYFAGAEVPAETNPTGQDLKPRKNAAKQSFLQALDEIDQEDILKGIAGILQEFKSNVIRVDFSSKSVLK